MGAALGRGDGVTVRLDEPVTRRRPVDRPFHLARRAELFLKIHGARKGLRRIGAGRAKRFVQVVRQTTGEVKGRLKRGFLVINGGFPADFDATEQVGLGSDRFKEPRRFELVVPEYLGVGMKGHHGAAPVGGLADLFGWSLGDAPTEPLFVQLFVARHLHDHAVRQRVHHRGPYPV